MQVPGLKGKSSHWMLVAVSLLSALALWSWLRSKGGELLVQTNVPSANVTIDGRGMPADSSGAARFQLPFGTRQLQLYHPDYFEVTQSVNLGWLSGSAVQVNMQPRPVRLTLRSQSGAEVLLDDKSLGRADANGYFERDGLTPGQHKVTVRLEGYFQRAEALRLRPPEQQLELYLTITPERQRQIEVARQEIYNRIRSARTLFSSREYQAAVQQVEGALKLDPENVEARQLRDRIVETMNILK